MSTLFVATIDFILCREAVLHSHACLPIPALSLPEPGYPGGLSGPRPMDHCRPSHAAKRRAALSLTSMRERTSDLGGSFKFEPIFEHDARVYVRLPLAGEED